MDVRKALENPYMVHELLKDLINIGKYFNGRIDMIRVLIKLSILFPRTSENFLVNRLVLLVRILTYKESITIGMTTFHPEDMTDFEKEFSKIVNDEMEKDSPNFTVIGTWFCTLMVQ